MKVSELIEVLQKFRQDVEVVVDTTDDKGVSIPDIRESVEEVVYDQETDEAVIR